MAETTNLRLPLLAAGQAQKHVTVNEALARLDALAPGLCESATLAAPPKAAAEGAVYIVPVGGGWPADAGSLCLWLNGGWLAVTPAEGWRVWVRDERAERCFDGGAWRTAGGGDMRLVRVDQPLGGGAAIETGPLIPDKAVVVCVTGRVIETLSGPGLSGWSLGVPGAAGRYGTGYALTAGSFAQGVTGSPLAYYGATPLLVQAEGGSFAAGVVRLQVHFLLPEPPEMP
jgi:hypothetical protein